MTVQGVVMRVHRYAGRSLAAATLAAVTLLAAACDKVPLLAPTNSTVNVTADAILIPSGGSTRVSAMVLESAGTPVQNGTTVRFTTNLGRVEPATAQTHNGVATTTFFADGTSGVASIRASSGAAGNASTGTGTGTGATTTDSGVVQITVGSAGVTSGSVKVRANPATVPVAGGSVEIVATAVGANNAPLPGVVVNFSTNIGTLSATSAVTDAQGEARVTLTTNREAVVTASVGNVAETVTVKIRTPGTVTLSGSSPVVAGQPFALTVTPASGTAPRVVIAWGDGNETDLGIVSAERVVTHVYGESGTFGILATATDNGETNTNALGVTVSPRPSPTLTVTPTTGTTATNFVFTVTPPTTGAGLRNVTIDFGDGSELSLGAPTSAQSVSHRYDSAGTYTVRVTLTDGSGAETFSVVIVTVS